MIKAFYDRVLRPVLSAHDSPEAVAGGVALGLGVALTPTMGIQMPIAWLVATLCGANRVVAMAMVWLSNPLTVAPMYYSEYLLGAWMLGRDAVTSYHDFQGLWSGMAEQGYLDRLRTLSDALLLPLVIGSMTPAVLLGAAAYPSSLWAVRRYRRRASNPVPEPAGDQSATDKTSTPGLDKPSTLPGPKAQAGVLMILGLLATSGCLDGNGPLTQPGVPEETLASGTRRIWSSDEGGTWVLLSPFHAAAGQDDFSVQRFEEFLGTPPGTHRYLALHLFRFDGEGPTAGLGRDGIPVTLANGKGRWTSRKPSSLLAGESVRNRGVLGSLLGEAELPGLEVGQSLRLLVALPGDVEWETVDSVTVSLPEGDVPMKPKEIQATDLLLLIQQPHSGAFDRLLRGSGS